MNGCYGIGASITILTSKNLSETHLGVRYCSLEMLEGKITVWFGCRPEMTSCLAESVDKVPVVDCALGYTQWDCQYWEII